ncbi:MAG: hypothetical protein K6A43_02900 [Treponema sp.]|jgi:uncharacterized protein YoxC|nr:hypothetical protein [Treponema sp.]
MAEGMTNKELMLEMFAMQKDSAVKMQKMNDKIEQLEEKMESHEKAMQVIINLPGKLEAINDSIQELKKNSEEKDKDHEDRIQKLEQKPAKAALSVWQKLFEIGLGIAGTMFFGWLFSLLMK